MITIKQFCERYPWPTESGMRAYIFRAADLGLTQAFHRIGRRVLIDPDKFFELVKSIEQKPQQKVGW
jgi:hypothetical protein